MNSLRHSKAAGRPGQSDALQLMLKPLASRATGLKMGINAALSIGLGLLCLLLMACASQSTPARPADKTVDVIYRVSQQEALELAHSALGATLRDTKIYENKDPRSGFYAVEEVAPGDARYARFLAKAYIHRVHVMPAQGMDKTGSKVAGHYFTVSGVGDLESGPAHSAQLKVRLVEAFERTGRGVAVTNVAAGFSGTETGQPQKAVLVENEKPSSENVFEQLKRLKELRDQEVITDGEFRKKKSELLDRI